MSSKSIPLPGRGLAIGAVMAVMLAAVLLSGGCGGAEPAAEDGEQVAVSEPAAVHVEGKLGPHVRLDDRVFTLISSVTAPRYAKLEIVLEFETDDPTWFEIAGHELELRLDEFAEEIPIVLIEDAITTAVSSKSADELASPEGKEVLREEIRRAVAELLPEPLVRRVLFTKFITQ